MTPSTVGELLADRGDGRDDAACVLSTSRPAVSRAQWRGLAHGAAAWLRTLGVPETGRVAVLLSDRRDMALGCIGIAAAAGCVPLNAAHTRHELDALFDQLSVALIVSDAPPDSALLRCAADRGIRVEPPLFLHSLHEEAAPRAEPLTRDAAAVAFYLATSGSSGTPKVVPLSHRNVCVSAANLVQSLALTETDRAWHGLPLFHVGGLVDLLLAPLASGGSVHVAAGPSSEELLDAFERVRPTWYQGVPTMLMSLCDRAHERGEHAYQGLRLLRAVSSALPEAVYRRCRATFGVPVIEIYGMTETAGVIASNPIEPGRQKPGSVGVPVGCEVCVLDDAGAPVPALVTGEIHVRGDSVMRGYLGDASPTTFVDGALQTGDRGYFDHDGYLFLTGRSKEMINRGGEKIAPLEIDGCLMAHPAVAEAASFAVPHPTLGEEVSAAVVLRPGHAVSAEELRQFLAERVADYKVPRVVHFVAALPRTPSHKLRRHALREELSKTAADGGALFVPSTPEGVVLAKLWRKLLKVDVVRAADSFFDQGADSLTAMTLLSELENECGLILGPAALAEHPTIAGIEAALRSAERVPMPMLRPARALPKSEARSEALGRLRKMLGAWRGTRAHPEALIVGHNLSGTAQPIHFCFDGAGEVYRLAEALGDDQPLYAMRSLWRVDAPAHVAPEIASLYCDEILALQPRGPYAVGGFCAGSSIAQHVATELVRRGAKVSTCLLVDPLDLQAGDYRAGLVVTGFGRLSLYQYYKRPELGLRRLFRGGVNLYRHHCDHQDCFEPPDVALTAKYMQEEIARSGAGLVEHPAQTGGAVLPDGAHRCAIVADVPKRIRRGGRQLVRVTITNTSPVTWGADQVSVCNRWPSLKTKAIRWLKKNLHSTDRVDGSTLISRALQPGESLTLELKIRAPSLPQLAALELDLVEEGICWFQEKTNRRPLRETVVVF